MTRLLADRLSAAEQTLRRDYGARSPHDHVADERNEMQRLLSGTR